MKLKKQLCIAGSCFLCALLLSISAYAVPSGDTNSIQQQKGGNFGKTIKGKVTDANNEPIIGASVRIKDQNVGTITDVDGNFSLLYRGDAPKEILVSFIGYIGRAVRYNGQATMNVVLEEDVRLLNEVVVTGYQTISKERATGAFAILNNQVLEKRINTNLTTALDGQVAGISTYGGDVVIRGRSTISEGVGTKPLLVVDGLPTDFSLDDINVNNVESMTILKDAAATSIYGSRAANGVIVVTMKQGEKGKTKVTFTADWTIKENPSLSDQHLASTGTYMDYEMDIWQKDVDILKGDWDKYLKDKNPGIGTSSIQYVSPLLAMRMAVGQGKMSMGEFNAAVEKMRGYDFRQEYMDEVWRNPFRQSYNLSISTGSDRQNTYASVNYIQDAQQMKNNNSQTFKAMIKNTQKVTTWLTVDLGLDAQFGTNNSILSMYGFDNMAQRIEPYNRIRQDNGDLNYMPYTNQLGAGITQTTFFDSATKLFSPQLVEDMQASGKFDPTSFNILDELSGGRNSSSVKNMNVRAYAKLNFQLYKGLKFTTSYDYERATSTTEHYHSTDSYLMRVLRNRYTSKETYAKNVPVGGTLYQIAARTNSYTFRNQLDYNTIIKEDHAITALAGIEFRENHRTPNVGNKYFGYDPQTFTTVNIPQSYPAVVSTGIVTAMYGNTVRLTAPDLTYNSFIDYFNRFVSFYGNVGYTYKNLYNLTASARIDQTNLYGTDPKYRYRPLWSVGASWNLSNEAFMKHLTWIDMLTIRGSYGVTGNVDPYSSPYILVSSGSTTDPQITPMQNTVVSASAPNPTLRWEKNSSYALGADFSLFKGMLNGKIEGYYKYSDDLLVSISMPKVFGFISATTNNGAISNKGVEITLSSPWYKSKDWKLSSTFIFGYNKNQIERVNLKPTSAVHLVKSPFSYFELGKSYNSLYAYRCDGITHEGTLAQQGIPIITSKDGTEQYVKVAEDGTLTITQESGIAPENAIYMGTLDPKWNGSFQQSVQFKNFELSAMFTFYGGHKVRRPTYELTASTGSLDSMVEDSWTPENDKSNLPKIAPYYSSKGAPSIVLSDYWRYSTANVVDGDLVRLRNISLSYTLPTSWVKKAHLQQVRMIAQANNIWYWSAAGDLDAETYTTTRTTTVGKETAKVIPSRNAVSWTVPTQGSYLFRLEVTF